MNKRVSGQALILLLLSMGAVLTVILSVASRTITDVSVTSKDEESLRAFSAAEAGVEKVLLNPVSGANGTQTNGTVGTNNAAFNTNTTNYITTGTEYVYPVGLPAGDTGTVWFVNHDDQNRLDDSCQGNSCFKGSSVDICWGTSGASPETAIEVSVVYETAGNVLEIGRRGFDPNGGRRTSNKFSAPTSSGCTISGRTFANRTTVTFSSLSPNLVANVYNNSGRMKFMQIRFWYNSTNEYFGVITQGNRDLPSQGKLVESTGTSGNASRKVQVVNLYPEMPSIFDAALFSSVAVSK
jgi:Tfp pilus assembly protein PilX